MGGTLAPAGKPPGAGIWARAGATAIGRRMPGGDRPPHARTAGPYDQACALTAEDDLDRCILSHYRPPPMGDGCSQAVWLGDGGPALVRNYDFRLDLVSDRFESTSWFGREVIAKAQRPWGGCIDGMNADGLVASLTAGGSPAQGLGFAVILLLRYVLETCSRVDEAVTALCRIPVALSQNVTLLDRSGDHATVFLGPDRLPAVSRVPVCTNHQDTAASRQFDASTRSLARHDALMTALADPDMTLAALTARMLEPPSFPAARHPPPPIPPSIGRPTGGSTICGRASAGPSASATSRPMPIRMTTARWRGLGQDRVLEPRRLGTGQERRKEHLAQEMPGFDRSRRQESVGDRLSKVFEAWT